MAEEIVFKVSADTEDTAADVNAVNKALQTTNEELEEVGNTGAQSMKKVGQEADKAAQKLVSPATRLEEMRNRMVEIGDTGSAEFQRLAVEAGALQDDINNVNAAVATASNDFPNLQVGAQAFAAIGGAAQGAMGAAALFGAENEDVTRSIQKLMAVQGLVNGVQAIANQLSDESALGLRLRALRQSALTFATEAQTVATAQQTIAQRALNFVMNLNPVFLIVTGVVALTAALVAFAANTTDARDAQELLNQAQEDSIESIAEETSKLEDLTDVLKDENASRQQKAEAIEELNKQYPEFLGNIDLEKATQEELNEAIAKQTELITLQAEAKALAAIRAELFKEKLELEMEAQRALTDEAFRWEDAIGSGNVARQTETVERQNRLAIIEKEIEATKEATQANRGEESSLLGVAQATELANSIQEKQADAIKKGVKDAEAARKAQEDAQKKSAAEREKQLAEQEKLATERQQLISDFIITNIEDTNLRRLTEIEAQHERERAALVAKFGEDTELLKQLTIKQESEINTLIAEIETEASEEAAERRQAFREAENLERQTELEGRMIQMRDDFDALQELRVELAEEERRQALEQEGITEAEKFKIQQEFSEKLDGIKAESAEREKQLDEDVSKARQDIAEQGLNAAQSLSDAVFAIRANNLEKGSAAELAAAKKQFKINKALQISSAIISGFTGVLNALSAKSVLPEPFASIQKGITATAVGLTAVASVASISRQQFNAGGGGGTVGAPSIPTAPVDTGGETDAGALGEGGSTITGAPDATGGTTGRVVIVDSEIKASLDAAEKAAVTSTIG